MLGGASVSLVALNMISAICLVVQSRSAWSPA
jgi:hypothetical protein